MEPAKIRRTYVNGPFGQMHVRMAGRKNRRALMCFHLSPASGVVYETWMGEMGKDRLVFAPDTPGFGMSDHPPSPPTIADYAEAMIEVMDAFDLDEVDVMGYHTGSKISVEVARKRPRRVKHLILVSSPIYTEEDLKQQHIDNAAPDAEADGSHLLAQWNALYRFRGPGQTPEMLMKVFPDHIRGGPRRRWGHGAAFSYTYPNTIVDVTAPILVLNPNDDLWRFTPRVLPYLKNGRVLDLPEWGHGFLDLHTAEAAHMLRPFLDDDRWPAGARGPT
jgi:pimeloyl-ACP methyl ester carboxylesterase